MTSATRYRNCNIDGDGSADADQHLHYKFARHPLIDGLLLPIIPDAELVDPEFGTGAVKITPAHDINDYEFYKRHSSNSPSAQPTDTHRVNFSLVSVFDTSGKMIAASQFPKLVGFDRLYMRKVFVQQLISANAYRGSVPHEVRVPICERSGAVIEPMLQPQWYLKMKPLAEGELDEWRL